MKMVKCGLPVLATAAALWCMAMMPGCSRGRPGGESPLTISDELPGWPEVRRPDPKERETPEEAWGETPVTLWSRGPWQTVVHDVCAEAGLSFASSGRDGDEVEVRVEAVGARQVLESIASEVGLAVWQDNGMVEMGERGVGQFWGTMAGEELGEALRGSVSEEAQVVGVSGSWVVVGQAEDQRRARAVVEMARKSEGAFVVEVVVLQGTQRRILELGLETEVNGVVQLDRAGFDWDARVRAALKAAHQRDDIEVAARGTVYVVEGGSGRIMRGERVPIPSRTVSPEGTITTSSYQMVEVGMIVEVKARSIVGGVLVELSPSMSEISGFVEEVPRITERRVEVQTVCQPGQWVWCSGLDRDSSEVSWAGGLGTSRRKAVERARIAVLVRVERVL